MSLHSGKRIHSYIWEELPVDNEVIARVEQLAVDEKQPIHNNDHLLFEWFPGFEIVDEIRENEEVAFLDQCIDEEQGDDHVVENENEQEDFEDEQNNTDSIYVTE